MPTIFRENEEICDVVTTHNCRIMILSMGTDVVRPINPNSSKRYMYIMTATYYFTKWPGAVALKRVDSEDIIKFLKDNILSRFSVPDKFITDNGSIFIGLKFTNFYGEYGIIMGQS
jgi:hypothetical protein